MSDIFQGSTDQLRFEGATTRKLFLIRYHTKGSETGWRIAVRRRAAGKPWWFDQVDGLALCLVGDECFFLPLSEIERLEAQFHIGTSQSWK